MNATGVAVEFAFPLGRYHATAAGTTANEAAIEWPPSPWRMLRAMVSVWKRRIPALESSVVVPLLDQLAGPCHFQLPTSARGHTRHYLVGEKQESETTFLTVDSFASVARSAGLVAWWPDAQLDEEQHRALNQICSEFTYLGRAESLCDARVLDPAEHVSIVANASPGNADASAQSIRLLTPTRPLSYDDLIVEWSSLRGSSKTRAVLPPGASFVDYTTPPSAPIRVKASSPKPTQTVTAIRFALVSTDPDRSDPRPRLSSTVLYASALRSAAQSKFGKLHSDGGKRPNAVSPTLSGRIDQSLMTGHVHAHYLALSDGESRVEARKITSLLLWAPIGLTDEEVAAVAAIKRLHGLDHIPGFTSTSLLMTGLGDVANVAPEICGPSRHFISETPAIPGRHPKGKRTWEEQLAEDISNALRERDLPDAEIAIGRPIRQFRTSRPRQGRSSVTHNYGHPFEVRLTFEQEQSEPIALGALSHFGLGLFRPTTPG